MTFPTCLPPTCPLVTCTGMSHKFVPKIVMARGKSYHMQKVYTWHPSARLICTSVCLHSGVRPAVSGAQACAGGKHLNKLEFYQGEEWGRRYWTIVKKVCCSEEQDKESSDAVDKLGGKLGGEVCMKRLSIFFNLKIKSEQENFPLLLLYLLTQLILGFILRIQRIPSIMCPNTHLLPACTMTTE